MPDLAGRTILQIIPELNAGGAERTTVDIAEALVAAGARALVACEGGRLVSELQARGGLWIPFAAKTKNPLRMALNVGKLQDIIRRERVDLVHARSRAPAWVALGAARRARVPFVTTYHGAYAGTSTLKVQYNSVMARGDVVIANSEFTRDRIVEMHPFASERIVVIHRGADLRAFQPDQVATARVQTLRRAWGVEPDERIVLLAARLTSWKGQRVLIDAAKALKQRSVQGVSFILAGDEQGRTGYAKELDERIAAAGRRFSRRTWFACPPSSPKRLGVRRWRRRPWAFPWSSQTSAPRPKRCSPRLRRPRANAQAGACRPTMFKRSPTPSPRCWRWARASATRSPRAPVAMWRATSRSK